jgi:DNA-binding response OmpR family regulator
MIADDDPVYRGLVEGLVKEWGYPCVLACDGNEAWEILKSPDGPDLVILDWMMPGLDGFEVCRLVRQANLGRDVYIILLTGSHRREEIIQVLVAGADDYLLKPFEPLDLKIRLRAAQRILDLQADLAAVKTA